MVDRPSPQDGPAPRPGDPGVRPYRFRMERPQPQRQPERTQRGSTPPADRERVARVAAAMRELAPNLTEVMAESLAYESTHPDGLPTTEQLGLWRQDEPPTHATARIPEARVRQQAAERRAVEIAQANTPRRDDYAGQGQTMRAD